MKAISILTIFVIGIHSISFTQDIHFSQTSQIPLLVNPASTGLFDGWERITANHKNQWTSSNVSYYTTALAFDMNLFKPKQNRAGAYMGIGLQAYNDMAGDAKIGTKSINLSVSAILPINRYQVLSLGIQGGIAQKSISQDGLYFGNQFTGQEFNKALPSNEQDVASFVYSDFSTGIYYRYNSSSHRWRDENRLVFETGISYYHLNRPNIGFNNGNIDRLYSKIAYHAMLSKNIIPNSFDIVTTLDFFNQGPHKEFLVGALAKIHVGSPSRITGIKRAKKIGLGLICRAGDAIIPQMTIEWAGWTFGMSYDVSLSKFDAIKNKGGLEFSLQYAILDHALFKRRTSF